VKSVKARITVYPRREILDPQGKAIRDALVRGGFAEVADVRAGKSYEVELAGDDPAAAEGRLRQMCEKLLANLVVEDYRVEVLGGAEGARS
jgi:phosphoribosylformylglycinamidine synthase PurS subunit